MHLPEEQTCTKRTGMANACSYVRVQVLRHSCLTAAIWKRRKQHWLLPRVSVTTSACTGSLLVCYSP